MLGVPHDVVYNYYQLLSVMLISLLAEYIPILTVEHK